MVEAAMVLPILILVVFSLILVMVHYYENHHGQIVLHKEMLAQVQESDTAFCIRKRTREQQTKLDGMVNHILKEERQYRIYDLQPAAWIRLGEMAGLEDG